MAGSGKRRAVFLDRDGTIIEDVPYLFEPEKVVLIKGAGQAIKMLNRMGFRVVVITNQSGVSRGHFKDSDVKAIHAKINSILTREGAAVDDYYYCPHGPGDACTCRKPETALVDKAVEKYSLDVGNSYVIGDKVSDIELAGKIGATSVLVRTGHGVETESEKSVKACFVACDIVEAVDWILNDSKSRY